MKIIGVFFGLAAVIGGLVLLFSPINGDDQVIGGALLAAGLTFFWWRTGFRGLK